MLESENKILIFSRRWVFHFWKHRIMQEILYVLFCNIIILNKETKKKIKIFIFISKITPKIVLHMYSGLNRHTHTHAHTNNNNYKNFFFCFTNEESKVPGAKLFYSRSKTEQNSKHIEKSSWELPGGPVVRIPQFHCWGPRFESWSGNKDPTSCTTSSPKKSSLLLLLLSPIFRKPSML